MSAKYLQIMKKIIDIIVGEGKTDELTPDEVLVTLSAIVKRIETKSLLNSIILTKRLSLTSWEG